MKQKKNNVQLDIDPALIVLFEQIHGTYLENKHEIEELRALHPDDHEIATSTLYKIELILLSFMETIKEEELLDTLLKTNGVGTEEEENLLRNELIWYKKLSEKNIGYLQSVPWLSMEERAKKYGVI